MLGTPRSCREAKNHRAGFTLVELLMVIGIIALLIGIVISIVRGVLGNARAAATKATIRKLDGILMKRIAAFERYCDGQDKLAAGTIPSYARTNRNYIVNRTVTAAYQSLGGMGEIPDNYWAAGNAARPALLLLARKAYFRQMFPQTVAELRYDSSWKPDDDDLIKINIGGPTEHSEVLYLSLTKLDSFGVEAADISEFKSNELKDTDSNGIPEFVDGWESPIRFYRWPTRLVRPVLSGGYGEAQYLNDNSSSNHEDWSYQHAIPAGLAYNTDGASLTVLITTPPVAPASASPPNLAQEHNYAFAKDPSDLRHRLHPGESAFSSNFSQWNAFTTWMEKNIHTPDCYHIPLLVSAGQDRVLGLLEPTDSDNFGHLAQPNKSTLGALLDDITNRNLKAGGN